MDTLVDAFTLMLVVYAIACYVGGWIEAWREDKIQSLVDHGKRNFARSK